MDEARRKELEGMSLVDLARILKNLSDSHAALKSDAAELYKEIEAISIGIIPEMMADQEITTMNIEGVGRLQTRADAWVTILKADKPEFMQWCIDSGNAPLVTEHIHPATLKAFIKGRVAEGKEYPQHLVKYEAYEKAMVVKV